MDTTISMQIAGSVWTRGDNRLTGDATAEEELGVIA
jgi:hypothetical protein